ncbi:MAG: betaine/proline/choline family ABC transporter ATP-binding protein [Erysipelothrix sp.]|nr:betaine/proline/choline family ABC transporter ATP-binding protein [Erysipelothrix sp.]
MIEFKNITKIYGANKAVDNLNLTIEDGEFVCFIGTSGSGKTTSMRMINRMVKSTSGKLLINNMDIMDINEVGLRRRIGYVIQQVGLMPHMTIYENIAMVPKLLKWEEDKIKETAKYLMERVDLPLELFDKYPSELSGGMQQRVGVIRALAADQDIILMDEPFGALDPITRDALQRLVKKLQIEMKKTIVFVTHDMDEALNMADKIIVMDHGKVVQQGSPQDILTNPANDFVRELVGEERLNQAIFEYNTVETIMREPIKINVNKTIAQVATLMSKTRVDDILVVDDAGVLVGRIDMRALSKRGNAKQPLSEVMKEVTYIKQTTSIRDAIYYVQDLGHRNISVVDDDGILKGIVTRGDIVESVYEAFWHDYEPQQEEDEEVIEVDSEHVTNAVESSSLNNGDHSA